MANLSNQRCVVSASLHSSSTAVYCTEVNRGRGFSQRYGTWGPELPRDVSGNHERVVVHLDFNQHRCLMGQFTALVLHQSFHQTCSVHHMLYRSMCLQGDLPS